MARSIQNFVPAFAGRHSISISSAASSSSATSISLANGGKIGNGKRISRESEKYRVSICKAMVQQQAVQGASAAYAKEMERLSAKESLLLVFKDAGGFEALVTGKTTDMHRIDVNKRIASLECLNPMPRPTT